MMRFHIIAVLSSLSKSTGKEITDQEIVDWANNAVKQSGKSTHIGSFKDSSLRSGLFLVDLINAVKPNTVNYDLITPGQSDDDATMNAKYAISVARKIGCTIFCLPEDIVEVKHKMILTFVGSVMAVALGGANH